MLDSRVSLPVGSDMGALKRIEQGPLIAGCGTNVRPWLGIHVNSPLRLPHLRSSFVGIADMHSHHYGNSPP